jgi:hypothetical protein
VDYCLAHEGVLDVAPSSFVLLEPPQNLVRAAVFDQQHVSMNVCKEHCLPALLRNKVPRCNTCLYSSNLLLIDNTAFVLTETLRGCMQASDACKQQMHVLGLSCSV